MFRTQQFLLAACLGAWAMPSTAHAGLFGSDGATCAHNTLQAAINAAPNGGTVYFQTGATLSSLSGHIFNKDITLQGSDANCTVFGTGTANFDPLPGNRALLIGNSNVDIYRLNLSFGDTTGNGGIIEISDPTSTLDLFDSTLSGGSSDGDGGCLSASGARVWLNNSTIEGCAAGGHGGAVALDSDAYLFLDANSTLFNATADESGGLLRVSESEADLRGTLHDGHAGTYGGGVAAASYWGSSATVTLHGAVEDCDAGLSGGGAYASGAGAFAMVNDAIINGNTAPSGGGVSVILGAELSMSDDATIRDNHATAEGGGVRAASGDVYLSDSAVIELNTAGTFGGGLFVGSGYLSVLGAERGSLRISDNYSSENGGGVALQSSTMDGSFVKISNNEAVEAGGGLYAQSYDSVSLLNAQINANTASSGGGISVHGYATVTLDADFSTCVPTSLLSYRACTELRGNTAHGLVAGIPGRGGAIDVQLGGAFSGYRLVLSGNTANFTGNDLAMTEDDSTALLHNALVAANAQSTGVSIDIGDGALDLRSSTVANQDTGVKVRTGASAVMHRNLIADNTIGAILDGTATGNCNLSQTLAESPTGANNDVGIPNFVTGARSDYQLGSVNPLVIDVCSAGPATDVDGKPRPSGSGDDRGAYERP